MIHALCASYDKLRLSRYQFQPCIFFWKQGKRFAIIIVYVDDILVATNDKDKLNEIRIKLRQKFEISDLGEVEKFLGMRVLSSKQTRKK